MSRNQAQQQSLGPGPVPPPLEEQIRVRAYEIFCARSGGTGDPVSDWPAAEAALAQMARDPSIGDLHAAGLDGANPPPPGPVNDAGSARPGNQAIATDKQQPQ